MRAESAVRAIEPRFIISSAFDASWESRSRYLVECGGRGSGKSEFAARKVIYRCLTEGPGHRFLVLRKVRSRCRESVLEVVRRVLLANGIPFTEAKTERTLRFLGNEILFDGLDDPEKIKSIKGVTSAWVEEATEFSEIDFLGADLILREPGPGYHQIILTFNPDEAQAPWLKKRFFDSLDPKAHIHVSTIDDNPLAAVREAYREQLDGIADKTLRDIYRLGLWGIAKGSIYAWDVVAEPPKIYDDAFYGGDFGYTVNPAAVAKVYRRGNEAWVEEVLYETGLTNQDVGERLRGMPDYDSKLPAYWDSAEQKSIEELFRFGIRAYPALKGRDSVKAGIDFLKSMKIHIVAGSNNIVREASRYKWREDKNGTPIPEPVKFDDHLMDAIRYAIFTHCQQAAFAGFSQQSFY